MVIKILKKVPTGHNIMPNISKVVTPFSSEQKVRSYESETKKEEDMMYKIREKVLSCGNNVLND